MRQALPKHPCLSTANSSDLRRYVSLNIAESQEVHAFLQYCVTLIYQRSKIHTVSRSCSNLDYITINRSQAWDNKRTTNMDSTSAPYLGEKLFPPNHLPITLIARSEFPHLPATTWHCMLPSRNIRKVTETARQSELFSTVSGPVTLLESNLITNLSTCLTTLSLTFISVNLTSYPYNITFYTSLSIDTDFGDIFQ
jgi:hypothetical protein